MSYCVTKGAKGIEKGVRSTTLTMAIHTFSHMTPTNDVQKINEPNVQMKAPKDLQE